MIDALKQDFCARFVSVASYWISVAYLAHALADWVRPGMGLFAGMAAGLVGYVRTFEEAGSGGYAHPHDDQGRKMDWPVQSPYEPQQINPSTGCPMIDGIGGVDTSGHRWGN
ncbi:hypothetical protein [Paraburkholderia sp. J8-2]|uniref:hypothetical protein n=1 Tax=Paraburkholderia sp. J8-2 TaxID=2805440 RepID=UPI002AB6587D|nr:hypothetical protein [Paraburkholderia sp. J8-2]